MGRRRAFVRNIKRASRRGIPFTRLFGSTVGMGLALAATSAWAQTPPAESTTKSSDGKDDVSLPGVDVQGQRNQYKIEEPSLYKLPDLLKDTPQSITVRARSSIICEEARLQPARCPAQRDRHQPGRRRGRRRPGRQPHAARLLGPQRHLHRRRARLRPVHARHLQPRVGRGAQGARPSVLFGRGSTGGVINQVSKTPKLTPFYDVQRHRRAPGRFGRATVDINQPVGRHRGLPAQPACSRTTTSSAATRSHLQTLGGGAVLHHRARDADPAHRQLLLPGRQQPARLRLPLRLRQAGRRSTASNFYGLIDRDFEKDHVHIGTFRLEHAFSDDIRLRNTLRYASYARQLARVEPGPAWARRRRARRWTNLRVNPRRRPADQEHDYRAHQPDRRHLQVRHVGLQAHAGGRHRARPRDLGRHALHFQRRADHPAAATPIPRPNLQT